MALTDNLIAYWKLDESSGNATDSGPNSLTFTNNGTTAFAAGKIANGADFGTSNSTKYFSRTADAVLQPAGNFSMAGWIKPDTLNSAYHWIFAVYSETGGAQGVTMTIGPDNLFRGTLAGSFNDGIICTTAISTGTWYFVAFTWDGTSMRISVNDGTKDSNTLGHGNAVYSSPNVRLGNRKTAAEEYFFDGMIDEFGFWAKKLSDAEVTSLYNGGSGLTYPFSGTGPANLKTYNTNVKANIKTINTNAIANVKTLDTNV